MIRNTYTCPLCESKTEDYFVSMNRDLECATDIRCANKNCLLNSNYVPFRIWTHIEDVKKNELRLQRENRMLSELIDKMALKPNQEIIEWHQHPLYPETSRCCIVECTDNCFYIAHHSDIDGWLNAATYEQLSNVKSWAYLPIGKNYINAQEEEK